MSDAAVALDTDPKLPEGPRPLKVPARLELAFVTDETGLAIKEVVGAFVYKFTDDPFAGGADRQKISVDDETMKSLNALFTQIGDTFAKRHNCCSMEEAVKYLPPPTPSIIPQ